MDEGRGYYSQVRGCVQTGHHPLLLSPALGVGKAAHIPGVSARAGSGDIVLQKFECVCFGGFHCALQNWHGCSPRFQPSQLQWLSQAVSVGRFKGPVPLGGSFGARH